MLPGRMTVCHVLLTLNTGGAEMVAARLARGLHGEHRFIFACLDGIGDLGEQLKREGFPVYLVGRRPGVDLRCPVRLANVLRRESVDLVHAHQYSPFFYSLAARLLHRSPPILFTEHGRFFPDLPSRKRRIANRVLLERRDHVVGVGNAVRQSLIEVERIRGDRIDVIYNGIDACHFAGAVHERDVVRRELGIGPDEIAVIQVARLDPIKDHASALAAISRLRANGLRVRLLVVGDGSEGDAIQRMIARDHLEETVLSLGNRVDVPRLLAAADIALLTSISEGIPLALIEAMAAALPVVATDVGGVAEVVLHGKTGLLAQSGDSAAISEAMAVLANDIKLRQSMGEAGRQRVAAHFSQESMHHAYSALYRRMADPVLAGRSSRDSVKLARRQPSSPNGDSINVTSASVAMAPRRGIGAV